MRLFADDADTGKTLTLTYDGLNRYRPEGGEMEHLTNTKHSAVPGDPPGTGDTDGYLRNLLQMTLFGGIFI